MKMLLEGDDPTLRVLMAQLQVAKIANRKLSGVGFFSTFEVPHSAPRLDFGKRSFSFGDVDAQIDDLKHGAGFVLHVRDGAIQCLEGYSYDEPWPRQVRGFRLSYAGGADRDLAILRRKWK